MSDLTEQYGCVYAWTMLGNIGTDRQKIPILAKKNHLFRWSSFWSWRVCKQVKLSHLEHRKPARIHWKADAPKTSHCLVWGIIWSSDIIDPLQSMAIVIGPCWTNFCSQKLKRRILSAFDFYRTALHATQPKLHSMFCALFLKIALSAAELMSFGHLATAIWHRWTIICGVPSKISVTPTSHRQLTLYRTIFVKPLVKYSCTQSIMCLQIGPIV